MDVEKELLKYSSIKEGVGYLRAQNRHPELTLKKLRWVLYLYREEIGLRWWR